MQRHYCTYFDEFYFPQGMAMLHSLTKHQPQARCSVLCLSEPCLDLMRAHAGPAVQVIAWLDLEARFPELAAVRDTRTRIEYYFTCTPFLIQFVLEDQPQDAWVTYLDADLGFFSDPEPLFEEIGNRSVAIIPHRFPEDLADRVSYGTYNVGWVSFRNDIAGAACLAWWASRCAEWCHDRIDGERFADQKYLDQFASRFAGVHVIQHPGANLAAWNIRSHRLAASGDSLTVDGRALIFFHFHGFRFPVDGVVGLPFRQYRTRYTRLLRNTVVNPWLKSLLPWSGQVEHDGNHAPRQTSPASDDPFRLPFRKFLRAFQNGRYQFCWSWRLWRKVLKRILFAAFGKPVAKQSRNLLRFASSHATWQEAAALAGGYDAPNILAATRAAMRKIVSGEAVFERDSMLMLVPEYPFSTIAGLLLAATLRPGSLHVVDYGGALGSTYHACRPWFDRIPDLKWSIVEQAHYVECGRREFTNDRLTFHHTLDEAVAAHPPDIVLLSGSLHFLPNAEEILQRICRLRVPYLLLERTPFCDKPCHQITIQHVPAEIYAASYACWLFNEPILLGHLASDYDLIATYPALDKIRWDQGTTRFKGMLLRHKSPA